MEEKLIEPINGQNGRMTEGNENHNSEPVTDDRTDGGVRDGVATVVQTDDVTKDANNMAIKDERMSNERDMIERREVETMLAEAEKRGYLRGRNESIEQMMQKVNCLNAGHIANSTHRSEGDDLILNSQRRSKWDE